MPVDRHWLMSCGYDAAQERQHASHTEHRQLDTLGPNTTFRRIPNIVSTLHFAMCAALHSLGFGQVSWEAQDQFTWD